MIADALSKLINRMHLTQEEMADAVQSIMTGIATPAQMGAFLVALRMKGETVEELTSAAQVMRAMAERLSITLGDDGVLLDTCGTGGDHKGTFNISTIAAFVIAGAGVKVAKHGNRAVTSSCGSADLMEGLGVKIDLPLQCIGDCISRIGFGFLYAPLFHRAMSHAAPVRRELGVRTIFNMLGPLTNPARAHAQLVGVYDESLTETFASVLDNLGCRHALVVHGSDGLDEITITGASKVTELRDAVLSTYYLHPESLSMKEGRADELTARGIADNVAIAREVLDGREGARRNVVLLNSAAGLIAAGKAHDFSHAVTIAADSIDSGRARSILSELVRFTNG